MLDGISDNMDSILKLGKCGAINALDPETMGYYVVNYLSETYILQGDQTTDGQVNKAGALVGKAEYLSFMKSKTNCYWQQHGKPECHNINPYHFLSMSRCVSYK